MFQYPTLLGTARKRKSVLPAHASGMAFLRMFAAPLQSALIRLPSRHRYIPLDTRLPEKTGLPSSFLDGGTANVDLNYDEGTDFFFVEADCDCWADEYTDFVKKYYPEEDPSGRIEEVRKACEKISGKYKTLKEINAVLKDNCKKDGWYEFKWKYSDGTPVE